MEADINCKMEAYLGSQNEEMTSFIKQGNYFTKDISLRYMQIRDNKILFKYSCLFLQRY